MCTLVARYRFKKLASSQVLPIISGEIEESMILLLISNFSRVFIPLLSSTPHNKKSKEVRSGLLGGRRPWSGSFPDNPLTAEISLF